MAFSEVYSRQVALLVRTLPLVAEEGCFGLKGGTAINLFLRNLPRLSVDIDLAYLPVAPRNQSLSEIDAALKRIAGRIREVLSGASVHETVLKNEAVIYKLVVSLDGVQIIIEVTPVMRGSVFNSEVRAVSESVESDYGFAEINTLSFADLYGGKIVAALDRQHPRDLFDICTLLDSEGIDEYLREAFLVYLISHNRPMHEILASRPKDIGQEFERGFVGMTSSPVALSALTDVRARLVDEAISKMPAGHKEFLLSFERGAADWNLLNVTGIAELPAVQWRMQNLNGLTKTRRNQLVRNLESVLLRI